ncbi:MAG: LLM class flavin-dependent oxidoreductase, partial [Nitrososphaeria archaeon]|nr:LLM class flavin-dependent oxidoreductase [Nitrososphaeria archaeon]NIN53472.1 LLM class flavin-dependent oxidoreductase [Nitrososphaeria archaeon]NIQ33989.1 LLM class flavin-dependent oxidoreductase [Nitrososphaeria archaeon]
AICEPKPVQKPHPPIWIGGVGERLLLRVTAELANVSTFMENIPPDNSLEKYKHKLEVLRRHCEDVGRNYDDIVKSWHGDVLIAKDEVELKKKAKRFWPRNLSLKEYLERNITGTPEEVVDKIWKFVDIGITYVIPNIDTLRGDNQLFSEHVMENFH